VVRRITGPMQSGLHRVAWDLRLPTPNAVRLGGEAGAGPLVVPGTYRVSVSKRVGGQLVELIAPVPFQVKALEQGAIVAGDRAGLQQFQLKTARLQRAVESAVLFAGEMNNRLAHLKEGLFFTVSASEEQNNRLRAIERRLQDLQIKMTGDTTIASRNEAVPMSIQSRTTSIISGHWSSQAEVTGLHLEAYRIAASEFVEALAQLRQIAADLSAFETEAERSLMPWTPGRLPDWQPQE
jgi:hypothetical protein